MHFLRTDRPLTPSWSLLHPSIALIKEHIWPLVYLSFLPSLVATAGLVLFENRAGFNTGGQIQIHNDMRHQIGLAITFIGLVTSFVCYPGLIYLQLQAIRGEHPSATECFKRGLKYVIPLLAMAFIGGILVGLGIIALIVPGLILLRGFLLAVYYMVDKDLGPIDALKQSYEASKPNAGYLWGLIGVEVAISILSGILGQIPILGYFISILLGLIYVFAPALRYGEIAMDLPVKQQD